MKPSDFFMDPEETRYEKVFADRETAIVIDAYLKICQKTDEFVPVLIQDVLDNITEGHTKDIMKNVARNLHVRYAMGNNGIVRILHNDMMELSEYTMDLLKRYFIKIS